MEILDKSNNYNGYEHRMDTEGCLYVIGNVMNSLLKIGITEDINSRFSSLQSSSPVKLNVIYYCIVKSMIKAERVIHQELERYRRHGEWFDVDLDIVFAHISKLIGKRKAIDKELLKNKVNKVFNMLDKPSSLINYNSPLNITEAAAYLKMSKSTLYKRTANREIPHYKPNNQTVYFKLEDLEKYAYSHRVISFEEMKDNFENSKAVND